MLKAKSSKKKINPREIVKKSYADNIQEELEKEGVEFFRPSDSLNIDEDYLSLPQDLTECPPKELGRYLNAFTQQKMYMRTLLGWCECMIEDARREYMDVAIGYYREVNTTKMSEKAKDLEVNNEPEVLPLYNKYKDLQMKRSMLDYNLTSIEDAIFLVSREISRRCSDFNDDERNHNVGRR